ncbi:RxLR-like protein [Phytophthora cinnamomi]|uniref:RxLR-like protein n=1 Tax=Phytophthora cinnamomi TaxID=4785 RepID=UPI003559D69A|nr:RxLR-like protein [Phytophthora cinnamomi]
MSPEHVSAYEAKRQRRIQRNQQQLLALDVPRLPQRARPVAKKKRELQYPGPVRRSLRQRQLRDHVDSVDTVAEETEQLLARESLPPRPKRAKSEPPEPLDLPVTLPAELWGPGGGRKQHVSSSQIEIKLEQFHSTWLGTQLLPVGKQTVMQGLCPPGFVAKFSKMSGVQPWSNAVVLFVNVESESPYDNVFRQEEVDGRSAVHFQWFGQNRWHDESPLVTRLRRVKRGDEALRLDESFYDEEDWEQQQEPLLLFLRHTQGPYIYCGRLGYLGHRPASKPLEFRWQLLDVDSLQWEKVRGLLATSDSAQ